MTTKQLTGDVWAPVATVGKAPDTAGTATLKGWYDASRETVVDGTAKATITDRSTYAKNLTQSTAGKKPVVRTDSAGSRYYDFDGVDDCVVAASAADWGFLNGGEHTVFAVVNLDAHSVDGRSTILDTGGVSASNQGVWLAFDNRGSGNGGPDGMSARCTNGTGTGDVYALATGAASLRPTYKQIVAIWAQTDSVELRLNNEKGSGATDASVTYAAGDPTAPLMLGARNNVTALPMNGRIHEVICYDGALSRADFNAVYKYLAAKWNVSCWTDYVDNPLVVESTATYDAFPSVTQAANGDVVAVARRGTSHLSDFGDIVQWRSTDKGITWVPEGVIFGGVAADCDLRDTGITALANGSLLLVVSIRADGGGAGPSVVDGCRWATSADNGHTWSRLHVLNDAFAGFSRCSTRPCQLAGGAILWPVYGNDVGDSDDTRWVKVYKSTDSAKTFTYLSDIGAASDGVSWGETTIGVSPTTKNLIALVRNPVTGAIYRAVSTDKGVTWSTPGSVLTGANSSPQFAYTPMGVLVAIERGDDGTPIGNRVSSRNDGLTWERDPAVYPTGTSTYGSPVVIGNVVVFVWAVEVSGSDSDVYASRFVEQ